MKTISKIFILGLMCFALSSASAQVSVGISVRLAPPALPVYVQPECPVDGYIWQPGYWAYDDGDGYYWVPGVWVAPPDPGLYWTPPYWGYDGGLYGYHGGYWGSHVGFYGGINYGYGYGGYGYGGGRWEGNRFNYNTAVVNINRTVIHNTYVDRTVINNRYENNHHSFNGPGGVSARPRPEEQSAMRERHIQPTSQQMSHQQAAGQNKSQFASVNHGRPGAAAMDKVSGRAFNVRGGHVAKSVAFGRPATGNSPARNANPARPANTGRHFGAPQQQRVQPQHNQQQRQQPQGAGSANPQIRMHLQPQQRAPRVEQQRQQPQQQQRQQQQRQQPQQQQRQQPQRQQPQQQQQRQQQPQQPNNNPRPGGGGGGKPHHG